MSINPWIVRFRHLVVKVMWKNDLSTGISDLSLRRRVVFRPRRGFPEVFNGPLE